MNDLQDSIAGTWDQTLGCMRAGPRGVALLAERNGNHPLLGYGYVSRLSHMKVPVTSTRIDRGN